MKQRQLIITVAIILFVALGIFMWKGYSDLKEFKATLGTISVDLKPYEDANIQTAEQKDIVQVCTNDRAVKKEFAADKIPAYCRCLGVNIPLYVYELIPADRRNFAALVKLESNYNKALATTIVVREKCRDAIELAPKAPITQ